MHSVPALADLDLPTLDVTDAALRGPAFHERIAELREQGWLARTTLGGVAVLDREMGEAVLRSKACAFPLDPILQIFSIEDGPLHDEMVHNIITIEGDAHRRLRAVVNPHFTPRAADAWRPRIRALLEELAAPLLERGRGDAVEELCKPLPARVIAELLGAPAEDAPRLHRWSTVVQRQFDAIALLQDRAEIEQAVVELHAYLDGLLATATTGLASVLREEERLSRVELVNLVLDVLIGGVDTTQAQLAHGLRLFAEHPGQWALLAEDPSLVPAAVEEVLRFEPITPFSARWTREELELRDVVLPAGTVVLVAACAANREAGGTFGITAARDRRILTFGAGTHYCLGANLARAELEEALAFLAPRMPGLALDGPPAYDTPTGIYQLEALPVSFLRPGA
jgi:cytochrome P450